MGVKSIAIRLGDNDYGNTFRPLLESLMRVIEYHGEITADQAKRLIMNGIEWHYAAFQNLQKGEPSAGVLGYLSSVRILFDADAYADTQTDCDGGAWFLNIDMGEVYAY